MSLLLLPSAVLVSMLRHVRGLQLIDQSDHYASDMYLSQKQSAALFLCRATQQQR